MPRNIKINIRSEFGLNVVKVIAAQSGATYLSILISTGYPDLSTDARAGR
jgi:hypothetical protein